MSAMPFPVPGEVLQREYLDPLKIPPRTLAEQIGVPATDIEGVLAGRRAVTADLDLRLSRFLGLREGFFLDLQASYDRAHVKRQIGKSLDAIVPWPRPG
jgi:addiction module HigA family antidote